MQLFKNLLIYFLYTTAGQTTMGMTTPDATNAASTTAGPDCSPCMGLSGDQCTNFCTTSCDCDIFGWFYEKKCIGVL